MTTAASKASTRSPRRSASARTSANAVRSSRSPYLLAIQVDSYREFLQENTRAAKRADSRPARGPEVGVPDLQLLTATQRSEYVELPPRRPGVRRDASAVTAV